MSNSQLIYEYLDSGLDDTKEDILFKHLYENKEYRDEFFSMVKYEGAASLSFANTQVPLSSTNAIFSNLGITLPNSEVAVVEKERPLVGFFTSIGSIAIFSHFRDYVSAFLGLLIGGLLTALIFMLTGNNESDNNTNKVAQQNFAKGNSNKINNSNNFESKSEINKSNGQIPNLNQSQNGSGFNLNYSKEKTSKENNSNQNRTNLNSKIGLIDLNNLSASNIINQNNSNSNISNLNLNQFSSLNLTDEIIKNLGVLVINNENKSIELQPLKDEISSKIHIDSTSNNLTVFNINNYYSFNSENLNSQLSIVNTLTEQTKEELFKDNIYYVDNLVYENEKDFNDFTLNFSGISFTQNNYNNQVIDFSNNIRLGLLYTIANNHSLGIEVGNEQFILPNQLEVYQMKNSYFIGANYKYEIKDLSLVKGVYPSIGTSINFATIGTIARVNLGLNLKPENRLCFGIYYEPSILFNNYKDLGINYSKNNIIIGISYKLE